MSNNKNKQSFQGKECFSRMNFLYQASMLMAGTNNALSAYYGSLCKSIGKKSVLRMHPDIKRTLCKSCSIAQQPGVTADLSVEPHVPSRKPKRGRKKVENIDNHARMVITCRFCKYQRSFMVNEEYSFWLDDPESVVETIDLGVKGKKNPKTVDDSAKVNRNGKRPREVEREGRMEVSAKIKDKSTTIESIEKEKEVKQAVVDSAEVKRNGKREHPEGDELNMEIDEPKKQKTEEDTTIESIEKEKEVKQAVVDSAEVKRNGKREHPEEDDLDMEVDEPKKQKTEEDTTIESMET